jgi:hypothetical protein
MSLEFQGGLLKRGFWLYVLEVLPRDGWSLVYYVGRTGDSSSVNAQSPFARMGQHVGTAQNSNMLRKHLKLEVGLEPGDCTRFRLVAHGPLAREARNPANHLPRRNMVAALERALAEDMDRAGYKVMNSVKSLAPLNARFHRAVRRAFAEYFPKLRTLDPVRSETTR